MTPPLLPQPLHSILLVIKTRSGPRLVLHYPPAHDGPSHRCRGTSIGSDDSFNDLDSIRDGQINDVTTYPKHPSTPAFSCSYADHEATNSEDSGLEFGSASADSMARLLTPSSRGWNKKRFELGLDDRTYLACPMFEREDGGWSRPRKDKTAKEGQEQGQGGDSAYNRGNEEPEDVNGQSPLETDHRSADEVYEEVEAGLLLADRQSNRPSSDVVASPTDREVILSLSAAPDLTQNIQVPKLSSQSPLLADEQFTPSSFTTAATSDSMPSQSSSLAAKMTPQSLSMFNLVFVLETERSEDPHLLLRDIYKHVLKKLAKALKWTQKRHGWLWNESRAVLSIREKNNERGISYKATWPSIAASSSLARAIAATYENITQGDAVHLVLGPSKLPLRLSLQVPQVTTSDYAPSPTSSLIPGLYTTTYDALPSDSFDSAEPTIGKSPHSALILMSSRSTLLTELTANGAITSSTSPLAQYVRHSMPTKTLLQLSRKTRLPINDVQALSTHLVHWRKAMAIPPLHTSHTYVVNPNADFSRLDEASKEFGKRYPALPSLVTMLGKLSGGANSKVPTMIGSTRHPGPRPYGTIIPSLDHKTKYMEMLEWMMREGWVSQLRTFAWVKVSAETKAIVANAMRREADAEAEAELLTSAMVFSDEESIDQDPSGHRKHSSGGSIAIPAFSPRLRALLGPPRPSSEAGSTSSAKTTVRISTLHVPAPKGADPRSNSSHEHRLSDGSTTSRLRLSGGEVPEDRNDSIASDFEPSIVLSPHRADALESRWLKHIGDSLPTEELRNTWPKVVRHFDGKHALEEIALLEGWKRKTTNPMLLKLMREDSNILLTVQHW